MFGTTQVPPKAVAHAAARRAGLQCSVMTVTSPNRALFFIAPPILARTIVLWIIHVQREIVVPEWYQDYAERIAAITVPNHSSEQCHALIVP